MLTNDDIKLIRNVVKEEVARAVAPLATKEELKPLATKVEVKKGFDKLERAIKREHKYQGEVLNYCEREDRKIVARVVKIERNLNFAPAI